TGWSEEGPLLLPLVHNEPWPWRRRQQRIQSFDKPKRATAINFSSITMIRTASRQFLHVRRGWSTSLGTLGSSSSSYHFEARNADALGSKRLMSSPSGGGWTWSKIIPGFGSKPIPPEEAATATAADSSIIREESSEQVSASPSDPLSSVAFDGQGINNNDGFPSVDESMSKIYESDPFTPESDAALSADPVAAIADQVAAFEPTWWPSDQCLVLLNWVHETAGFPCFAVTIGATTIAFRTLLFPLFVSGQRNSSRMAHVQPELTVIKNEMEKLGNKLDQQTQLKFSQQTKALFKKYDVNPFASLIAPLVTAPVFMSMFFALRNAPEVLPGLLATGGMLWFPDLNAADPYCIMPVMSAATFLAMTEVGKEQMVASGPTGRTMVNVFRALAVVMVPLTMSFNSAIFCYWTANNSWSFLQTIFLKQPAVRKYFGIWDPPQPVPGQEAKNMFDEVGALFKKKEKQLDALSEDRIKAHNTIVEQQKTVKKQLLEKKEWSRRK
ncbi:hypothetical protein ACHAWF_013800, partial [Thalassiosira exigua]